MSEASEFVPVVTAEDDEIEVPDWVMAPFQHQMEQVTHLSQIVRLAIQGFHSVENMAELHKHIVGARGTNTDADYMERQAELEKDAELARSELSTGCPILYAQAVVSLWGILEAWAHSVLVEWLRNEPSALRVPEIQRLRIRLGEYLQLQDTERYEYTVDLLEQELSTGRRSGITGVEALLQPFGLGGEVSDGTRRTIFELGQIRNVIVHKAGLADRQLLEACPWLDASSGEAVRVSRRMFGQYTTAIQNYVGLVLCRIVEHYGLDLHNQKQRLLNLGTRRPADSAGPSPPTQS